MLPVTLWVLSYASSSLMPPGSRIAAAPMVRGTASPRCVAVYGRCLSSAGAQPQEEKNLSSSLSPSSLKAATLHLSAHDRRSMATPSDPMATIEEFYDEYFASLQHAVRVLAEHSKSVMLGFMGDSPAQAVDALRAWQQELELSQPPLQVVDETSLNPVELSDTVVLSSESTVPTYLKFNSANDFNVLKAHGGPFRGVVITATLDGTTRQFGGLPLSLFDDLFAAAAHVGDRDQPSSRLPLTALSFVSPIRSTGLSEA